MNTNLIHPDMIDSLGNFFPEVCTIQEFDVTKNGYNEPTKSWSDKFTDLKCAIGEAAGKDLNMEDKRGDKTVRKATHRIVLKDAYDVSEKDRVKIGSDYFDVLLVTEGVRGVKTSLICQKLSI